MRVLTRLECSRSWMARWFPCTIVAEPPIPTRSSAQRSVHNVLVAALFGCAATGHAANCTVEIPEYLGQRSGECFVDSASQVVVIYDAEYWGNRGRKLLVPLAANGRKTDAFIEISPSDVRSNNVAHQMSYGITIKTRKGVYRFEGRTRTQTYQAHTPPEQWVRQRPNEAMNLEHKFTTAEMLAEIQTLKSTGPALPLDVIEKVVSQNQDLSDRLPTLAGISQEGQQVLQSRSQASAGLSPRFPQPDAQAQTRASTVGAGRGESSAKAANPATSTSNSGLRPIWPSDMEAGNIYFVVQQGNEQDAPLMVSALSGQEAVARVQAAWAKDPYLRPTTFHLVPGRECIGPSWGAVVSNAGRVRWGAACATTPAAAIEGAFTACRQKNPPGQLCEVEASIVLVLSGSTSWGPGLSGGGGHGLRGGFGAYSAQTWMEQYTQSPVKSMQQALSGFDKACNDGRPCYKTPANMACIHQTEHAQTLDRCLDRKLTPVGLSGSIRTRLR
ncbi:hypothetical protein PGB34_19800 [Xenophilus arseniciresistens]|uniref:DUF4189 domain-containing protein n=1 Tax=Xenophilus arseniciresistens TaxID=1283306 RepID=A0AAE3NBI5_9BURK|nr:hypothetical protein [Xenophilus arseniciresistens]MDA7418621.1 hypothetical protein [Xenophilus arseniciresistens]